MRHKDFQIISMLRQDSRIQLTKLSKKTGIPVSTLFEKLNAFKEKLNFRFTALVDFNRLGYPIRGIAMIKATGDRKSLMKHLEMHPNCNSLRKINNGFDFMAELIHQDIFDFEKSIEEIEARFGAKVHCFYNIKTLKEEGFLINDFLPNP